MEAKTYRLSNEMEKLENELIKKKDEIFQLRKNLSSQSNENNYE